MIGRFLNCVLFAVLAIGCVHVEAAEAKIRVLKGKPEPKPKPNPKSKPKPGNDRPGHDDHDSDSDGGLSFCAEHFNRSDTTLKYLVECGDNYVCLPTAESVVAAVGLFDVTAAMKSSATLDIRCISTPAGSEGICDATHTSADCESGEQCVAAAQPTCLTGCTDGCYHASLQQGSYGEVHDRREQNDPAVSDGSFSTFFIVNACIGVIAAVVIARKVWQTNSEQFAQVPTQSGHEMVFIEEVEDSF